MRHLALILLLLPLLTLVGAEPGRFAKHQVTVTVAVEDIVGDRAVLVGTFTPNPAWAEPLHLYGLTLPDGSPGIPTRVFLPADSPLTATGPLTTDQQTHDLEGLPVFAPGPVQVRLPVRLPARGGGGGSLTATVLVSYLACTESSCLVPVTKGAIEVVVPTVAASPSSQTQAPAQVDAAVAAEVARQLPGAVAKAVAETVNPAISAALDRMEAERQGPAWKRPASVAELEALLAEAAGRRQGVLLDFTGPSCLNCQVMEKTVFHLPAVRRALGRDLLLVQVDTDPPHDDLSEWQQQHFATQARPLYVRLPGGTTVAGLADPAVQRWSQVFRPTDQATLNTFLAFLAGGAGIQLESGGSLWWLAVLGGLVTLLMPCTYPMIPFTLSFFAKQSAAGRSGPLLALAYGGGIIASFVGLGLAVTLLFGSTLATLAGSPVTNLIVAALFVGFGLSLLGVLFLRLPGGVQDRLGAKGGFAGAMLMGLVFALSAFTCTAPIAGALLAAAATSGAIGQAVWGLGIYGLTIAVPLVALALVPGLLKQLPKSGGWLGEVKIVGGLVELAAALKFLVICDHAWGWGLFGRTSTLVAWSAIALVIGFYVMGAIRWKDDAPLSGIGLGRLLHGTAWIAAAVWLGAGVAGLDLGLMEGFFPGDPVPGEHQAVSG